MRFLQLVPLHSAQNVSHRKQRAAIRPAGSRSPFTSGDDGRLSIVPGKCARLLSDDAEMVMRYFMALICLILAFTAGSQAHAEKRVALVIGNGAYQHTAKLNNPGNDAGDLSAALQRLNFEVVEGKDLDKREMERLIRQFGIKLAGADVALFFYAGHGLQVGGQNYLVPTDAKLANEGDIDFESLSLALVMKQMEREAKTSLVLLDACRDNPLARNLSRNMGTRNVQVGQGLAEVRMTAVGTLIAFSTQPGYVALDGNGRNSPYAEALLKHIEAPGSDVSGVLVEVRNEVLKATAGKQVPWEHTSLTGQVFLRSMPEGGKAQSSEPARLPLVKPQDTDLEIALWNSVKDSKSSSMFDVYLARYPNGTFAGLARVMLSELNGGAPKPTAPTRVAVETKPDRGALTRSLQTELKRVGCYSGAVDGDWGEKTSAGLAKFARASKVPVNSDEPTTVALEALTSRDGRVCTLECGQGTVESNGKCVATQSGAKKTKSASSKSRSGSSSSSSSSNAGERKSTGTLTIGVGRGGRIGIGF